jgi:hypothetical protein
MLFHPHASPSLHHLDLWIPCGFWTPPSTSTQGRARRLWSALGERESSSDLIQISYPTAALKYSPEKLFKNHIAPPSLEIQHRVEYFISRAETAAIRQELAIRHTENAERVERAKKKFLRAKEKALRLKAEMAFLAAGGARGDFAREWPSVFLEEVRGDLTSTAVNGS